MKRFAIAAVLSLSMTGCAGWGVFASCVKTQAPKDLAAGVAAAVAIASQSSGYVSALLQFGKEIGPGSLDCIVQALIADTKNAKFTEMLGHLHEYLQARLAMGVDPTCKPEALASL